MSYICNNIRHFFIMKLSKITKTILVVVLITLGFVYVVKEQNSYTTYQITSTIVNDYESTSLKNQDDIIEPVRINKNGDLGVKTECFILNPDGTKTLVKCGEFSLVPNVRPKSTMNWDIDSLERAMEIKLINSINRHRKNLGLRQLKFSQELYNKFTLPHTLYQVEKDFCTHYENGKDFSYRWKNSSVNAIHGGENVASHQTFTQGDKSQFFEQYMNSEPHKKLIENPKYSRYATSVIYDKETNVFYNTFNVIE